MKALRLRLKAPPPCCVDAAILTPAALAGRSRAEIERIELSGWNERFRVGDLFGVRGTGSDHLVLEALEGSFLRIGAGLEAGRITVDGHAGDYLGEGMRSGTIDARGEAGDFAAAGLRGGTIEVAGSVGAFAGSARAGEMRGMSGGILVVRGNAGDRAGDRMRRGLLLVGGGTGAYCAARMLAGTIVALGGTGELPGYLMRRGTLLIGQPFTAFSPTFNHNGSQPLVAMRLLLASIARHGAPFRSLAGRANGFSRWVGDLAAGGKGEIFVPRGG